MINIRIKNNRFRKNARLLLAILLLCLSSCSKASETVSDKITDLNIREAEQGGFISSFLLEDHQIYLYQPEDIMKSDIINYGYSAPLLLVFGDKKADEKEAVSFIIDKEIDKIAQQNGGFVLYLNPMKSWDKEEYGIYEKILAKTMVAQSGFAHGFVHDNQKDEDFIFASPALTCLYGLGKGADYIAQNYLKET